MNPKWREILGVVADILQIIAFVPLAWTGYHWLIRRFLKEVNIEQLIRIAVVVGVVLFAAGYVLRGRVEGTEEPRVTIDPLPNDPVPTRVGPVQGIQCGVADRELWLVVHYGTGYHVQPGPATLLTDCSWDHPTIQIFPQIAKGTFMLYAVLCDGQTCEKLRNSVPVSAGLQEWPIEGVEIVAKRELRR